MASKLGRADNLLWAPKVCYTLSFGGYGAMVTYLPIFAQQVMGLSKVETATLQTIQYLCAAASPPLWGAVADALDNQRLVHICTYIGGSFLLFLFQFASSFTSAVALVLFGNILYAAGNPLLDTAVLHLLEKVGGDFGKQRIFDPVGFGMFAYIAGALAATWGLSWAFNLVFILSILTLIPLRHIPAPKKSDHGAQHPNESTHLLGPDTNEQRPTLWEGIKLLAKEVDVLLLLLSAFFMAVVLGAITSFYTLNLFNLSGKSSSIVGTAILLQNISNLPFFFFAQAITKRIGITNVLLLSAVTYCIRIAYYAVMTNAWSAVALDSLHGLNFALIVVSTTEYVYARSPAGCEATVIGLLNGIQTGLGFAVGSLVGGVLYEEYGPRTMWWCMQVCVLLSFLSISGFAYFKNQSCKERVEPDLESATLVKPSVAA